VGERAGPWAGGPGRERAGAAFRGKKKAKAAWLDGATVPANAMSTTPSDLPPGPRASLGLVTSVRARGRGIILLAGPSSCGKGAVALALRRTLHLPPENHVSMGEALREVVDRSAAEPAFREEAGRRFGVHADRGVFDAAQTPPAVAQKAQQYEGELRARFGPTPSQVDWLAFCVTAGLLVPDAWSEKILEGVIAARARNPAALILLDGYPRTEVAARHVLDLSQRLDLPVLKVIHLSISKREMHRRALGRKRMDDTPEMLERRYQFYVDHVQPAMELLKLSLGSRSMALIDAQQPAYRPDGALDLEASVRNVAHAVLMALGVSRHILDNLEPCSLTGED
jgi:adenylate kinase family enzyme